MIKSKLLAAAVLGLAPLVAFAGTFNAHVTGAPGSSVTMNVTFAGDGSTTDTDVRLDFNNTFLTFSNPVEADPNDICQVVSATRIRIVPRSGGATPLPGTPTQYCSFTVAIGGAAPEGNIPFTINTISCSDNNGDPVAPCTLASPSGVTVQNAPINRTLSYDPAAGSTITFPAGVTPGQPAPAQTIVVTANGNAGTATLTGCATTGPAGVFSVTPTDLTFNDADPNPKNLSVGCTYPATTAAGTLTCSQTNAGSTATNVSWSLSCPAPNANPTIGSNPASGSTFSVSGGSVGSQGTATIDLTATGGSGAGTRTISCTSTGTVQIAASPGTPAGQGPVAQTVVGSAQPTDLRVGVALTNAAQTPAGTITCTVTGQADLTYTVNAPAGTTFTPPEVIPSASAWSKIALFGLLGLFGVMALGFRRQG